MAASLLLCCPPPRHPWQGHCFQFFRHGAFVKNKLVLGPVAKLESQHSRHWRFEEGFRAKCSASSSASGDAAPADIPSLPESSNGSVNTSRWKPPKVRVAIGVAIVATGLAVSGILLRRNSHPRKASQLIADLCTSASSSQEASQFTVKWFGRQISLSEKSPGYMYFLLLMAAGFGLFVSEEALNVWVRLSCWLVEPWDVYWYGTSLEMPLCHQYQKICHTLPPL